MVDIASVLDVLKSERDKVQKQLSGLNAAIGAFASVYRGGKPTTKRRKLSAQARAKIGAAQRARWAKIKAAKKTKKKKST
jgi:hypothetical protein